MRCSLELSAVFILVSSLDPYSLHPSLHSVGSNGLIQLLETGDAIYQPSTATRGEEGEVESQDSSPLLLFSGYFTWASHCGALDHSTSFEFGQSWTDHI